MPETKTTESFEKELLHALRFSGMDKENLNELVRIVVELNRKGFGRVRVFPKGIPVVDSLEVQTLVDSSQIDLLTKIFTETPRLRGVSVFPYGIPNPEIFQVNVELGQPVQAQTVALRGVAA
jgi:hypothetical protein